MTTADVDRILADHEIHPKFRSEFHALVFTGKRPSKELRTRLDCVTNYKAALDEVLGILSQPYKHLFTPAVGVIEPDSFESITFEESAA